MFEVGQTVWCVRRGQGIVTKTQANAMYPIRVEFNGGRTTMAYTDEGKFRADDCNRALFFSEPKVEGATEPPWHPKLKKGDQVVLKSKMNSTGGVLRGNLVITIESETKESITDTEGIMWYKILYSVFEIGKEIY